MIVALAARVFDAQFMKGQHEHTGQLPAPPKSLPGGAAPANPAGLDRAGDPIPGALPALPSDLKGRKILVVDDQSLNRRILQQILQSAGFTVIEADSGEAALARYGESPPDLVLLDVMMPVLSGFDTCRELKRRYGAACAPIIFVTAKTEAADVLEGLDAGVDYLPKPVRAKEALARIRVHVQNRLLMEELTRANAAKNKFLGMAAHDLRSPLATIRGLTEFLQEGAVGPMTTDQLDLVATMHTAAVGMIDLVNELLDVATIEAGELKLHRAWHQIGEPISQSIAQMKLDAAKKQTRIIYDTSCKVPALMVDANKLRQVVDNLLSNAIKFSPPGSTIRVGLFLAPALGQGGFCVQDMGPGIADADRDKLFKDFSRLSAQPTAGEKSTGLGLAICLKIVQALQGSITATNLPAGGCEWRVSLPLPS